MLLGEVSLPSSLTRIELREPLTGEARLETLVIIPYRQIAERGFEAVDDQAPLLALQVAEQAQIGLDTLLERLPKCPSPCSTNASTSVTRPIRRLSAG
ncbi:hypothetical protein QNM99_07415 [Pseudomonas sp. PCH446]